MAKDGRDGDAMLARFAQAGIEIDDVAKQLQVDGAASFVKSWKELLDRIADKTQTLANAGGA